MFEHEQMHLELIIQLRLEMLEQLDLQQLVNDKERFQR
jgi:hypothetical protein